MLKPDKLYKVPRKRIDSFGDPYMKRVRVRGENLTEADVKAVYRNRAKNTALGVAAAAVAELIIGFPGTPIPQADALAQLRAVATADFSKLNFGDKYQALYLKPRRSEVASTIGGWGLLSLSKSYYATVGQTCMVDKAYNTNPSEIHPPYIDAAKIPAPAGIGYDEMTDEHTISAYGGNQATMLRFKYDGGDLIPDRATKIRLADNGCNVVDGAYFGPSITDTGLQEGTGYTQTLEPLRVG